MDPGFRCPYGQETPRRFRWTIAAIVLAVAVNLVVFAMVPAMIGKPPEASDMDQIIPISMREVRPPEPEKEPEPEPPIKKPPPEPPAPTPQAPSATAAPAPEMPSMPSFTPDLSLSAAMGPSIAAPAPVRTTFEMGEVDRAPMGMYQTQPVYPFRAKRMQIEGTVTIRFLVGTNGHTSKFSVINADPEGIFEEAVRQAVAAWRFEPAQKDGKKVATWVVTPIRFQLQE